MADVELRLTADVDEAVKGIGSLSKEYQGLVNQLAKPLRQVNAFRELESSLESTERQTRAARDRVRDLGNELARTAEPSKQLTAQYRDSVNELRKLERAERTAQQRLAARRSELQAAGVDTRNLAVEQKRLSKELQGALSAGQADQRLRAAQSNLGVGELEKTQRQLVQLRNEYRLVMAEGDLSAKQRAEAEANYRRSVAQTLASLRQLRAASAPGPSRNDAQAALRAEAAAAADAAEQQRRLDAQRTLGVGRIEQTQQALVKLRTQYREVMADATLSGRQRSEAEAVYHQRVQQTLADLRNMRAAIADQGTQSQRAAAAELQRSQAARQGIRAQSAALAQLAREQRAANLEAARQNLGVTQYRQLQSEIVQVRNQYQLLRTSGKLTTQELAIAQQQLTQRIRESRQAMNELTSVQSSGGMLSGIGAQVGLSGVGAVAGVTAAATLAAQYAEAVDPIKKMEAQLKLATKGQEEFSRAQSETFRIAQENQAPLVDVVTLYSRLAPALNDVGRGQGDALKIIDAVTKSLRISGATAAETASTIQQFSQALGSGVLRGEEFNTLAESSPRLLRALSDGLKVNVGALRAMAAEGKLTADVISGALIGQLSKLSEEAAKLPDTFGGAVTKLGNAMQVAIGKFDQATGISGRLIDQINRLTDSINLMASGAGDKAVAGVTKLTAELGRMIPMVDLAYTGVERLQAMVGLKTTTEQLQEAVKEEAKIYDFRAERLAAHAAKVRNIQKQAGADTKKLLDQQVKDTEAALKRQVDAERKAASDLDKAKKAQLDTQQRYQEALANLNAGSGGTASYSQAQSLKVAADAALRSGDVEGAKRQAQAALQVLQELAAAGENTYGFAGFIKQLQAIETAADQQNVDAAAKSLEQAQQSVAQTKVALEELKKVKVAPTLDEAAQQQLLNQLGELAKKAGILMTIPATVVMPESSSSTSTTTATVPGFATGGYTGPGARLEPAGVVHRGEVVWSQLDVARAGGVAVVEAMRRGMRGYDMGGIVAPRVLPSIPTLAPALQEQLAGPSFPDLGRVVFEAGGQEATLYATQQDALNLRRLASKFGGSTRRK